MIVSTALLLSFAAQTGWQPLFNGKDLSGWKQLGGKAVYRIEGDEIVGRTVKGTPNSFLCTEKFYANFELQYDVKVDPRMNSGVQIRSHSVGGYKNGQVHGYQIEVDPSKRAWSGGLYEEGRRGWLHDLSKDPTAQAAFKNGVWNHFRVRAVGDHIQVWVNGIPTTDHKDDLTSTGFIGLQVHNMAESGVEVRFKNLMIRDYGSPSTELPRGAKWLLHDQADIGNWVSESKPASGFPWKWENGYIEVVPGTSDIISKDTYTDFQAHVEFMTDENGKTGQANGNSGVYIQQSYEVQILNSAPRGPLNNECAAIYTKRAPDYAMAFPAGQWQTYDIWFEAARFRNGKKVRNAKLTLRHNGTIVHREVSIDGPTGAGKPETPTARPIRLQNHGNKIRFRNIWVKPL